MKPDLIFFTTVEKWKSSDSRGARELQALARALLAREIGVDDWNSLKAAFDGVREILAHSKVLRALAHKARDRELVIWVTQVRMCAERYAGQLLIEAEARGWLRDGGNQCH
jgi:hypothetical protein